MTNKDLNKKILISILELNTLFEEGKKRGFRVKVEKNKAKEKSSSEIKILFTITIE